MKYHLTILNLLFFFLLNINLKAEVIVVPKDYATIQEAIDSSQAGDTVLVRPGTYFETLYLKADIFLLGSGYNSTFIDGEGTGNPVTGSIITLIGSGSSIEGFTIENANQAVVDNLGAGINGNYKTFIARKNRIRNCRIGVRIYGSAGSSQVERNLIYDNSSFSIVINLFSNPSGTPKIINNTIYNSKRGIQYSNSQPVIINNIVMKNGQYGIVSYDTTITEIRFNDVFSNGSDYQFIPNETGNNGNITADPLFLSELHRDFNLRMDSPCIDAGDTLTILDPDSTRADMGALYFPQVVNSTSDANEAINILSVYPNPTDGIINISEHEQKFRYFKNYTIQNISGQIVKSEEINNSFIDIHSLQPGIYFLTVYSENEVYSAKVLKM